jgi:hypothetical protein
MQLNVKAISVYVGYSMFVYKFTVHNFHLQDPSTIIIQSNEMQTNYKISKYSGKIQEPSHFCSLL